MRYKYLLSYRERERERVNDNNDVHVVALFFFVLFCLCSGYYLGRFDLYVIQKCKERR